MATKNDLVVFVNEPGPLPLSAEVAPTGNAKEVIFISGSCFADQDNQMIGFEVLINGEVVGASKIFSDAKKQHRATVPVVFEYNIPFTFADAEAKKPEVNAVKVELKALDNTQTNEHDLFNLTIVR